jgi:PAT family beta-lactamase induction signal transducer AmpG
MNNLIALLRIYTHPHAIAILLLGFASGIPLALTASTITVWLFEIGVNIKTIGLFALVGTPYALKFVWAPIIDQIHLPLLTKWLGRRVSWILFIQLLLIIAIISMGFSNPAEHIGLTAILAVFVAFCSASQDVVIDAYRIELCEDNTQGIGVVMTTFGYRVAMLTTSAGALWLSQYYDWSVVYMAAAACILVGTLALLINGEPAKNLLLTSVFNQERKKNIAIILKDIVLAPLKEFVQRPGWRVIILFALFFKLGDAMAGVMTNPFLMEIGFSKIEIAKIVKTFGFFATLVGLFVGGWLTYRIGMMKSLFTAGILQMLSNLVFIIQAKIGYSVPMLALTIGLENFTSGIGTCVVIAYYSSLCNVAYTASQYALLSSIAVVARTILSSYSGFLAFDFGWTNFFLISALCALPGLALLFLLNRMLQSQQKSQDTP